MADVNDFNVHAVNVKDDVDFNPVNFGRAMTTLTFWVGTHGPFRFTWPKEQATSAVMKSAIDHQVAELRRITEGM
jgi:hypothetical protein